MNDTIADFLTRLRNAGMAQHAELNMPSSKVNASISSILKGRRLHRRLRSRRIR